MGLGGEAAPGLQAPARQLADLWLALDAHAIVSITDAQGTIVEANARFCQISQYPRAMLLGATHRIVNSGHHPPEFFAQLWETIRRGEVWKGEIRNRARDGSFHWMDTTIVPVLDAQNRPRQFISIRTDITDRKLREQALRDSDDARHRSAQGRLRAQAQMLDAIGEAVIATDAAGTVVYANRAAADMYGWPADAMLGRPIGDVTVPDGQQQQAGAILDAVARGQAFSGEFPVRRRDGSCFDAHVTTSAFFDEAGGLAGYVGVSWDLSARKRDERRLRSSNRALAMMSRCNALVVQCESERDFLQGVCDAVRELGAFAGVHVAYAQAADAFVLQAQSLSAPPQGSCPACAGGDPAARCGALARMVRETAASPPAATGAAACSPALLLPLADGGGRFGVLAVCRAEGAPFDEDEPAQLQELARHVAAGIGHLRARRETRRLAGLLDQAQEAIVVRDMGHRVTYWNQGAERLLGWAAAEALGRDARAMLPVEDGDDAPMRALLAQGDWRGELRTQDKHGRELLLERRWTLLQDDDGQAAGVLSILTDISERKRAEQALQRLNAELEERVRLRTAQLEAAIRELEAFSYSVSHDLRAPLAAISGFATVLDSVAPLEGRARHALNRIQAGGRQMEALIEGLLTMGRLSRGELRWEPVDLSAMADEIAQELQAAQPREHLQWVLQPGLHAEGDPRLLRQVLANLLGNAWKFTGGRPAARIEFQALEATNGERVYCVADDGPGFDMAYADKLFVQFQRLHTQAEYPGTGIGLATVQRIVQRHGGRVWADSAPGAGARFHFTLGARPAAVQPAKPL